MLTYVPSPRVTESDGPYPAEETEKCRESDEEEPEPEEHVDLLVEEIDRKYALDGVPVDVTHLTYFKVAERDAGKPLRCSAPVAPRK